MFSSRLAPKPARWLFAGVASVVVAWHVFHLLPNPKGDWQQWMQTLVHTLPEAGQTAITQATGFQSYQYTGDQLQASYLLPIQAWPA